MNNIRKIQAAYPDYWATWAIEMMAQNKKYHITDSTFNDPEEVISLLNWSSTSQGWFWWYNASKILRYDYC